MKRKKMLRGEKNNIQMYREAFYSIIINQDMLVELPKEKQNKYFWRPRKKQLRHLRGKYNGIWQIKEINLR